MGEQNLPEIDRLNEATPRKLPKRLEAHDDCVPWECYSLDTLALYVEADRSGIPSFRDLSDLQDFMRRVNIRHSSWIASPLLMVIETCGWSLDEVLAVSGQSAEDFSYALIDFGNLSFGIASLLIQEIGCSSDDLLGAKGFPRAA